MGIDQLLIFRENNVLFNEMTAMFDGVVITGIAVFRKLQRAAAVTDDQRVVAVILMDNKGPLIFNDATTSINFDFKSPIQYS